MREAAARATVVLRNEGGLLPLDPGTASIALIGANALEPFVQGGGSDHVTPPHLSLPRDALREAFPSAAITTHRGGRTLRHAPLVEAGVLVGGEVTVSLLDAEGRQLETRTCPAPWDGTVRRVPAEAVSVRVEARVRLDEPGRHLLEVAPVGAHRTEIGGELLSESTRHVAEDALLDSSAGHPRGHVRHFTVGEGGREMELSTTAQVVDAGAFGRFARVDLRHLPPGPGTNAEIAEAVEAAREAEVAVVVVGTNPETESEGWDRSDLELPGRQYELVRRVAEANPRTVVVVNAGAPVLAPWLDEVAATLWWWLPGQEAGGSLADVLTGACEPSGRLPWTLPAAATDVPVPDGVPREGVIDYVEGLDVGHRGWDRRDARPPASSATGWATRTGPTANRGRRLARRGAAGGDGHRGEHRRTPLPRSGAVLPGGPGRRARAAAALARRVHGRRSGGGRGRARGRRRRAPGLPGLGRGDRFLADAARRVPPSRRALQP